VIARTHVRLADDASRTAAEADRALVFLDQDLVSTVVYARHYYGDCPHWIERLAAERRGDLYLLCRPDLPWTSDGVRDRPAAREEIHALFAAALDAAGARVADVSGSGEAREALAAAAVDAFLTENAV
jgi:nicotinamide riboside kinase